MSTGEAPTASETSTTTTVEDSAVVIVRDGKVSDWPLLYATVKDIYGKGDDPALRARAYAQGLAPLSPRQVSPHGVTTPMQVLTSKLDMLRQSPDWRLIVACPSHEPDELMGLLLYKAKLENPKYRAMAWIAVKPQWQRKGIARELMRVADLLPRNQDSVIDCAFWIPNVVELAKRHGWELRFRPYLPDVALYSMLREKNENG